ncbi:RNA polymerase sigma factor [Actomonas aquatica]|uniref:RNA polymerase sigma factor n=1 Tax=Actomonas aquatica TaxID=2866162 RepID=A0ABZ1C7H7_9BACT|nr:RNA polymerase sigma factor [Opitutus sp. WL0086]WRQ86265.1 RNA polymerase sigma factor [Opitutus sp. WL0086]
MTPSDSKQAQWFSREVLVHEAALRSFLRRRYPSLPDIDDLVQESFLRVFKAHGSSPIHSVRAFLYTTARNLATDYFRRRQVVAIEGVAEVEDLAVHLDEVESIPDTVAKNQEVALLIQAIKTLPPRCRQVLTLRKIYGMSQRDIAERLGITEHTVEAHVGAGVRKCGEYLAGLGLP